MAVTFTGWSAYSEDGSPGVLDWTSPATLRASPPYLWAEAIAQAVGERSAALSSGVSQWGGVAMPARSGATLYEWANKVDTLITAYTTGNSTLGYRHHTFTPADKMASLPYVVLADILANIAPGTVRILAADAGPLLADWAWQVKQIVDRLKCVMWYAGNEISGRQRIVYSTGDILDAWISGNGVCMAYGIGEDRTPGLWFRAWYTEAYLLDQAGTSGPYGHPQPFAFRLVALSGLPYGDTTTFDSEGTGVLKDTWNTVASIPSLTYAPGCGSIALGGFGPDTTPAPATANWYLYRTNAIDPIAGDPRQLSALADFAATFKFRAGT